MGEEVAVDATALELIHKVDVPLQVVVLVDVPVPDANTVADVTAQVVKGDGVAALGG